MSHKIPQASQCAEYFRENLEVFRTKQEDKNAEKSERIAWQQENIERYLRSYRNLRQALTPLHETFFQQILSQQRDGMLFLIQMRADLLQVLRKNAHGAEAAALRSFDHSLKVRSACVG